MAGFSKLNICHLALATISIIYHFEMTVMVFVILMDLLKYCEK